MRNKDKKILNSSMKSGLILLKINKMIKRGNSIIIEKDYKLSHHLDWHLIHKYQKIKQKKIKML
jgi:hypothetical protein